MSKHKSLWQQLDNLSMNYWSNDLHYYNQKWYWDRPDPKSIIPELFVKQYFFGWLCQELIGLGYHSFKWEHNSDTDKISLDLYDNTFEADTDIESLVDAFITLREQS